MNETYSGGIGSFLLTLMIVSFLQMKQRQSAKRPSSQPDTGLPASLPEPSWNLGTLLLEFFQLYGVTFNYFSAGISIPDGGSYLTKRKRAEVNNGR
jgi:non-canonical poly(A) RNA polymerase PAPD5/7